MNRRIDHYHGQLRCDLGNQGVHSLALYDLYKSPSQSSCAIKTKLGPIGRIVACIALGATLLGCGGPVSSPDTQAPSGVSITKLPAVGNREKQAEFLNQIRSADPDARTVDRALINEKNELGLILDRTVELENIPSLMRLMLTKMAAQFPGEDLTVLAYTPSNPPRKVGTARLNARTRDMSYTKE